MNDFGELKLPHWLQWTCSYNLSAEYIDVRTRREYEVRFGTSVNLIGVDYLPTVAALIGTVTCKHRPHEFPPDEIMAFFPRFVGARFREDWSVEYDGLCPGFRVQSFWIYDKPLSSHEDSSWSAGHATLMMNGAVEYQEASSALWAERYNRKTPGLAWDAKDSHC